MNSESGNVDHTDDKEAKKNGQKEYDEMTVVISAQSRRTTLFIYYLFANLGVGLFVTTKWVLRKLQPFASAILQKIWR